MVARVAEAPVEFKVTRRGQVKTQEADKSNQIPGITG
jgi:hypothetical protein